MPSPIINHWEYSKWVVAIGRALRLNPAPAGAVLTAAETFFTFEKTKRPWLQDNFFQNSIAEMSGTLLDNPQVLGRQIDLIGKNIMKIPVIDAAEKTAIDDLIAATSDRRDRKSVV